MYLFHLKFILNLNVLQKRPIIANYCQMTHFVAKINSLLPSMKSLSLVFENAGYNKFNMYSELNLTTKLCN